MRIKIGNGLLPLNLLVWLLLTAILFFPYDALRITLGFPFVLFFPGYSLVAALFPKKEGIGGIERVVLSLGMSIVVVPLIGLILNYTAWGITLESMLYSIASFILIISIVARIRRRRLVEEERFGIEFQVRILGDGAWDRAFSVILALTILGALGMLGYVIVTPKVGERFTEFYILGQEGKAIDYPVGLRVGEGGKVIVGIINHEYETVSYRVDVRIDGVRNNEIESIVLEHDEKWEGEVNFTPEVVGEKQKVEFLLYKNGESEPYLQPLHLSVNVKE